MAHELATNSRTGRAAMFYVRKDGAPWHTLGEPVEDALTWADASVAAGQDWDAVKTPLQYAMPDGTLRLVARQYAMIRSDTSGLLGMVSDRYQPVQNREMYGFLDRLVDGGELRYHTAGCLKGGRVVWMLAKLPEQIKVVGDDVVDQYLLMTGGHDGKMGIRTLFTPTRVVCWNTLSMALSAADSRRKSGWTFNHTGDMESKLAEARSMLGLARDHFAEFGAKARELAAKDWTELKITTYFERLYPGPKQADTEAAAEKAAEVQAHRDRLRELFDVGVGLAMPGVRGTAWAAYNAVAEHLDHDRPHRARNRRSATQFESSMFGPGRTLKNKALDLALAMS
ncbi:DUF932 domain-containing protein [Tautonia sp. JC769]|uniref:DUF932 domain-containing protein n=1 Tax=Tautonia sp. JC769 TaxID=3232135 RepID=UPI003458D48F